MTPAVAEVAGSAESMIHEAADSLRGGVETLASKVREQPLLTILTAVTVGLALGRMVR